MKGDTKINTCKVTKLNKQKVISMSEQNVINMLKFRKYRILLKDIRTL